MHELIVCRGHGRFHTQVSAQDIGELREHPETTLWFDLTRPDAEELRILREEFKFHHLSIEDATRHHQRPKVDSYDNYYFVVFYCLDINQQTYEICTQPLYLFIGHNFLVTIHDDPIKQIKETVSRWQSPDSPLEQDVGSLVYALLDAIVDDYFPVMDQIADRVEDLEEQIFGKFDEGALESIFRLKKDLLSVRRVVTPERDVLNVMLRRDIPVFDQDDVTYLQDVYDHIIRVVDSIDTYRDLLSSSLDTFLSVQSNQLNQVVKALTITSIVLMSVAIVSGVYGMNFEYMPELHWRYGYLWALGLMAAIALGLIGFFRRIKWL
ncbi:MAG TPA: magnesium/cobalt transporter CorA [Herpetosiphonaceae bacterium]